MTPTLGVSVVLMNRVSTVMKNLTGDEMKYFLLYGGACLLGLASKTIVGVAIGVGVVAVLHGLVLSTLED